MAEPRPDPVPHTFAGARLKSWHAVAVPVAVMALSDIVLKLTLYPHHPPFDPFVYASFLINVLLGRWLCRTESVSRIGLASVLASVQFFLVTNFGYWLVASSQPDSPITRDLQGLLTSYLAAIPFLNTEAPPLGFFGNMVLGDLCFAGALFGLHAWLARTSFPRERVAPSRVVS
jgi:hypothetical protein